MPAPSFNVTPAEALLIRKIAARAVAQYAVLGVRLDRMSTQMDLMATHANGCPLRLADLLAADDFNFSHDISGIYRHLDRETGKLTDHLRPRFAQRVAQAETA